MLEELIKGEEKDYNEVYKTQQYNGDIQDIIEKIVILSHLDDRFVRDCIDMDTNPLESMFAGTVKCTVKELQQGFKYFNSYYREVLSKALVRDIERISVSSVRGRKTVPYTERTKYIESQPGGFITGYYQKEMRSNFIAKVLLRQIIRNIEQKKASGVSQEQEILAMEQLGKGIYTPLNLDILKRLITEANSQLKLKKLPKEFRQYEHILNSKVSVESFYKHLQDPRVAELIKFSKPETENYHTDEHGNNIIIMGTEELPPELKGRSYQEIEALNPKVLYRTPLNLESEREDFKETRKKFNQISDEIN